MKNLSEFSHNHHPSGVKMLAKYQTWNFGDNNMEVELVANGRGVNAILLNKEIPA